MHVYVMSQLLRSRSSSERRLSRPFNELFVTPEAKICFQLIIILAQFIWNLIPDALVDIESQLVAFIVLGF